MKKLTLQLAIIFFTSSLFAQWIPVNSGLPDYPPTAIVNWVDTMVVSTYGGGIFLTYDQGENWIEMPGTLPNLLVNNIDYQGGQFDPISVSTDGGPFICVNGGYIDCNGTGLTANNINWWSAGNGGITGDVVAGTRNDGTFAANYTSPFIYDWYPASAGLTGDALTINDGLVGEDFATIATNGGMYQALGTASEWTPINDGLSGEALKVNDMFYLGFTLLATDGGLYYSLDMSSGWLPIISDEKFNVVFYINTTISPSGFMVYALGENGFYTKDFENWFQMDFGGIEGEVTAAQADDENLYIGFTADSKDGKLNGGMYRRPLEEFLVAVEDTKVVTKDAILSQNFPNPFNRTTNIKYSLTNPGIVSLNVFDITGREILSIDQGFQTSGIHSIPFSASQLDDGIYFYSLRLDNKIIGTKKMMIQH